MIDALVVGGGPAGSSAALRLARAGLDVVVLERARFPRTKVCGEYVSPGACKALADLGLLEPVASKAHALREIGLAGFGSDIVRLRLPASGALSMPRDRFDALLLDGARLAGAGVLRGAFVAMIESDRSVTVGYRDAEGADRTIEARVLVGADGAWSAVAQRAGLAARGRRGGRWAVGGHLRAASGDGDLLEMHVGTGGYYARNPLGAGVTNSMLVLPRPARGDDADRAVADITGGRLRFDEAAIEKRVAIGPMRYAPSRVARGRVLLAGDAAGLLDPFVGQGMAIALESSRPVAEAALALLRGERRTDVCRRFAAARRASVLPRRMLAAAVDAVIRTGLLRARAERGIRRDPRPAEALLAAVAGAAPASSALTPRAFAALLA